jgi:hypothetical protein
MTDPLGLLFWSVLHPFSIFSLETYLDLWLSVFPCNHANEVLSKIVSIENLILSLGLGSDLVRRLAYFL